MRRFLNDRDGAIAVYAAFVSALIIGSGVLALDFGKAVILKAQMQNAADSSAMSGALQLNGQVGALDRATAVARDALIHGSSISDDGDIFAVIQPPIFYSTYDADTNSGTVTTSDADAIFIEVNVEIEEVTIVLEPILAMISAATGQVGTFKVDGRAVATPAHIVCDHSPFFICNPNEPDASTANPANDLMHPDNINAGRQLVIKEGTGGSFFAPGDFGLLCPDPDVFGNCGARAINEAIAAVPSGICEKEVEVETAPGTRLNQVVRGLNQRFGLYGPPVPSDPPPPAKDMIGYGKDSDHQGLIDATQLLGNGNWDFAQYWADHHPGDDASTELGAGGGDDPSRYQVWLYENGQTFWRNGKRTINSAVPVGDLPPGSWFAVTPPGTDWPTDPVDPTLEYGVLADSFTPTPIMTAERRTFLVPLLNCEAFGVRGSGEYPTLGQFVEVFVSECACAGGICQNGSGGPTEICETGPVANGDIWAEVVGPVTISASGQSINPKAIYANIRLVD